MVARTVKQTDRQIGRNKLCQLKNFKLQL